MSPRPRFAIPLVAALAMLLAACASMPAPNVQRSAAHARAPQAGAAAGTTADGVTRQALEPDADADAGPRPIIRRGTGQVINRGAASAPPPNLGGSSGAATFNFEGESLQAVDKASLGDMLGQN